MESGSSPGGADKTVAVLDAATGKLKDHYPSKTTITQVLSAPDSAACFVVYDNSTFSSEGHQDNYIIRLRVPDASVASSFRSNKYLRGARLSFDGRRLLVLEATDDQETLRIFNADDLMPLAAPSL